MSPRAALPCRASNFWVSGFQCGTGLLIRNAHSPFSSNDCLRKAAVQHHIVHHVMHKPMYNAPRQPDTAGVNTMRTTITLDDKLLKQAEQAIGTDERSVVIHEGLRALVQREAARRLIQLGGSVPNAQLPPRRRPDPDGATHRKRA